MEPEQNPRLKEIQDKNQKPISTKHMVAQNYDDESKETLIKWLVAYQANEFKIKSEYHEIYHQQKDLRTKLLQEKNKNQDLEKEINEYDTKIGMIKEKPIEMDNNVEDTSVLPPIHKLSDYQIWKNQQDNIVYRKKVLQKIKNNDNDNNKTIEFDECCICYEENNSFKIKTNCKHDICMSCILKMNKTECPLCREPFPEEITKSLKKESGEKQVGAYLQPRGIDNWFSWSGTPKSTGFFL